MSNAPLSLSTFMMGDLAVEKNDYWLGSAIGVKHVQLP